MKKFVLVMLILCISLIVLSGCQFIQKDAKYECQVSVRPTGKAPCDFVGGKDHICQLYGVDFEPQDIPDECFERCLDRSKFLTSDSGWDEPIDPECIKISLAHSGFAKPDLTPEERRIKTEDITYEDVEEAPEDTGESAEMCDINDKDCCLSITNMCWIDGECKKCSEGDCQFESDCAPICEENMLVKQWCNPHTAACEPEAEAFWTDCTKQKDTIAGLEISRVCKGSACVVDETTLQSSRQDLVDQYNKYTYARQEVTKLRMTFDRYCLRALSDVTNKLIIDTALMMGSLPTSMMDVVTDNVAKLIDTGANKMVEGDQPLMGTEEFIAYSCNMNKVLTQELKIIDKKQEIVLEQIKEIESKS